MHASHDTTTAPRSLFTHKLSRKLLEKYETFYIFAISFVYFTEYSKLNPHLFSRYLPNILPPTDPALLDQYAEEAHQVQEHIAGMNDFAR